MTDAIRVIGERVDMVARSTTASAAEAVHGGVWEEVPSNPPICAGMVREAGQWRQPVSSAAVAAGIRREFKARIADALGGKSESILRWGLSLQNKAFRGVVLSQAEQADVALMIEIDAWEGRMIETRETLIAGGSAAWPPPPAGLTPEWLKGF